MLLKDSLRGKIILLTEDDAVLASALAFLLEDHGATVDGPARRVETAMEAISRRMPDGAILDVELLDGEVFPVTNRLKAAGVPIVFYTAKGSKGHEKAKVDGAPVVGKIKTIDVPVRLLAEAVERSKMNKPRANG